MMATDRQHQMVQCQWVAVVTNVLLSFALILWLGVYGAAVGTLVSESLLVLTYSVCLRSVLGPLVIGLRAGISLLGSGLLLGVFLLLPDLPFIVVVPLAMVLYLCVLILFRDIRKTEFRLLASRLRGPR